MLITLSELTLDGCYLELVERTWMDDILKKTRQNIIVKPNVIRQLRSLTKERICVLS